MFIGASGHGKVCAEIAELSGKYDEMLFLDDDKSLTECGGYPVVGVKADFEKYIGKNTDFFVSIGKAITRRRIQEEIEDANGVIATLIHPKSVVSKDVEINRGTVIMAGTVINAGSRIEQGVIVNTSSSIDHDCQIRRWSHIAVGTHICGSVEIGESTWIGAGTIVSNNCNICGDCTIGAGAVVVKDINEAGTYVGIPVRRV